MLTPAELWQWLEPTLPLQWIPTANIYMALYIMPIHLYGLFYHPNLLCDHNTLIWLSILGLGENVKVKISKRMAWGFWGIVLKSGLRILIRAPEVPFLVPSKWQKQQNLKVVNTN